MQENILTIHSVNPTGMFSFGLNKDINVLNKGLVHLTGVNEDKDGDSNGSGKSSLFNATCELLFRENPTGCKGDAVINSMWGKGMAGRVYFTNAVGEHYRVTYCRKWKDSLYASDNDSNTAYLGTSLYLDKYENNIWVDKRGSGMPQTHTKILEVIGMTYSRFLAIAYMSHRVGDQFLRGTNKDRMGILSGITGIEEWDDILLRSRAKKKALGTQISSINDKTNFERGSLQTLKEQYQSAKAFNWSEYIDQNEKALAGTRASWKECATTIKKEQAKIDELVAKQAASYNKEKVDKINSEIQTKTAKIRELDRNVWSPPAREKLSYPEKLIDTKTKELNFGIAERDSALMEIRNNLASVKGQLKSFMNESGSLMDVSQCPTCEGDIPEEKKSSIIAKIKALEEKCTKLVAEEADLLAEQSSLETQLLEHSAVCDQEYKKKVDQHKEAEISIELENGRLMEAHRVSIEAKRDIIHKEISELTQSLQAERDIQDSYSVKIREIEGRIRDSRTEQEKFKSKGLEFKNHIDQANQSLENLKALGAQIDEKKKHLSFYEGEIKAIQDSLDVYLWLIDNIPFIKLHKMSVSMSEISDLVNDYLEELGDSMRVSITSFEEKTRQKNAADVKALMKSDVNIEIMDGSKNIDPRLYSDGESSKISIAIIRALNELARKYGQGCNLMFMDEVFSFVDSNNSQKIAASMSKLLKKGTVFLTDNSGAVTNLIDFDHTWVSRKRLGKTELEV